MFWSVSLSASLFLCTMTHPALGSVTQPCTVKKKNPLCLKERFLAFLRARSYLVLTQIIVQMGATEMMK